MALTTRLPSPNVEPFYGFVETTGDALRLIQAARQGLIPRITRRLNDLERRSMIRSGSVFIFSNEESGIKRWTEGLSWSASRIVGNFLVYREVTERGGGRISSSGADKQSHRRRPAFVQLSTAEQAEKRFEKSLVGCLADGHGRFKSNGLIKKTITVKIDGSDHHLIAYYKQEDVKLGRLLPPTSRADIMGLDIPPELLESTKFRIPPKTEPGPDGRPRYICDIEELDSVAPRLQSMFPLDSLHALQYSGIPSLQPLPFYPPAMTSASETHVPRLRNESKYPMVPAHLSIDTHSREPDVFEPLDQNGTQWFSSGHRSGSHGNRSTSRSTDNTEAKDFPGPLSSNLSLRNNRFAPYATTSLPTSCSRRTSDAHGMPGDSLNVICPSFEPSYIPAQPPTSRNIYYPTPPPSANTATSPSQGSCSPIHGTQIPDRPPSNLFAQQSPAKEDSDLRTFCPMPYAPRHGENGERTSDALIYSMQEEDRFQNSWMWS